MTASPLKYQRYALYFVPQSSDLAAFGTQWLGWDIASGQPVAHPQIAGLPLDIAEITQTPRRYGFHGTIVPPFRMRAGQDIQDMRRSLRSECTVSPSVKLDGMEMAQLGRFLALVPTGQTQDLQALASRALEISDPYRAPPKLEDLKRHRAKGLTPMQDQLLQRWGYPYVMDQFRFHMTLTGKMPKSQARETRMALAPHLAHFLTNPLMIDHLALVGEAPDGRFHLIEQLPLGPAAS